MSIKLAEFDSELAQLRKAYQTAKSNLADSQAGFDLLKKENDSLRDRLFESESSYKKFSSTNEQLETALNGIRDKFAIIEKAKDTASTELEGTTRERNLFRVEIDQLTRQLRGRTMKILAVILGAVSAVCFAIWASYTLSNQAISEKLDGAQIRIASLEKEINGHLANLLKQKTILGEKDKNMRKLEETASKLQEEIEGLNGILLALKKQKDGRIATLGENILSLNTRREDELEIIRRGNDAKVSDLKRKIGSMEKQVKSLMRTRAIAIPSLIAALDHPALAVRTSVSRSLEKLTAKKYGTKQDKWRKWWLQNRLMYLGR